MFTESIQVEMIPGSARDLEKKTFTWAVDEIQDSQVNLDFWFENPIYIS